MLSFVAITPHPPIIIPEVGGKDSKKCTKTIEAMVKLSDQLAEVNPDTIIIISPHALTFTDRFAVNSSSKFVGDLGQFRAPEISFNFDGDPFLAQKIIQKANELGVMSFSFGDPNNDYFELDHGVMVPMYYLKQKLSKKTKILPIAFSYLNFSQHYIFGQAICDVIQSDDFKDEKIALIASGDLSHRLIQESPVGFSKAGKEFDQCMVDYLKNHHTREILEMDQEFIESAGECGYRSILIALGALDGLEYKSEILSYEGPFGVGYLVANFKIKHEEKNE